jgi:hypothetical protein
MDPLWSATFLANDDGSPFGPAALTPAFPDFDDKASVLGCFTLSAAMLGGRKTGWNECIFTPLWKFHISTAPDRVDMSSTRWCLSKVAFFT